MRRFLVSSIALGCLAGCAGAVPDEGRHIVGVVTSSTTASTPAERPGPGPFVLFGAVGGLIGAQVMKSADETTYIHNRLYVKTSAGEVVVDTDEYFPSGSCVEITPSVGEQSSTFFSYRSARVTPSDKC